MKKDIKPFLFFSIIASLLVGHLANRTALIFEGLTGNLVENINAAIDAIIPALQNNPFMIGTSKTALISGAIGAACVWLIFLYNVFGAKNFMRGSEHGSARWGTAKDIKPLTDREPDMNIPLSATEQISVRKVKDFEADRNKNIVVVGGSGSGKTYSEIKPSLMQLHSSYVIRLYSKMYNKTLTCGRVQTPTINLIVNRQRSIENFVPQTYFTLTANCGSFKAYSRADDQAKAQQIVEKCSGKDAYVSKAEKEEKREKPAALYDLTTLQRDANRLLGYSAQQTLDYLQKLYDNKLATYPRTDSRYITADQEQSTRSLIDTILATGIISTEVASNYSTENVTMAQIINDKKVSDHHAVLPTSGVTKEKLDNLPTGERNILLLVSYRLLSAVYAPHTYTATKVVLDIEGEPFTATGREEIDLGFKQIDDQVKKAVKAQEEKEDAPDTPENAVLPPMSEGNTFTASEVKAEPKKTKPQPSYTEDTLLKAMETAGKSIVDEELKDAMKDSGLGTPATRAGIIENIVKAGYIVRNGKKLLPTETAYTFIDLVTDKIKEPELTAEWEKQLAAIQRGEKNPTDFMQEISGFIRSFVMDTKALYSPEQSTGVFQSERESIGICPKCGKKVVEYPKSFSCESGKGGCGFVIWKTTASKAISKAQAVKLLAKGKTDLIKGFTSKAGKPFDANLVLKEDKTVGFDFPPRK